MVADIVVRPVPDTSPLPDSVIVDEIEITNGGDALNTAVTLGMLGSEVYFIGRAGNDAFGHQIVSIAKARGVCTDHVRFSEEQGSSKVIALIHANGDRNFLHYPGANQEFCFEDISLEVMKRCSHFHVGGTFHLPAFDGLNAAKALRQAKEFGLTTSMDVAFDHSGRWLETISCCLPYLDYFLPSIGEAECMFHTRDVHEVSTRLKQMGVRNVLVKMGEDGVFCSPSSGPAFTCDRYCVDAVDTTGAGDAFVGGFISALDAGMTLEESVVRGTANAAFVVQKVGATAGVPDMQTLQNYIDTIGWPKISYE